MSVGVTEISEVVGEDGAPQGGGQEAATGIGGADAGAGGQTQLQAILPPPPTQPPSSAARIYDINYAPLVSTVKDVGEALENQKKNLASVEYRFKKLYSSTPKIHTAL